VLRVIFIEQNWTKNSDCIITQSILDQFGSTKAHFWLEDLQVYVFISCNWLINWLMQNCRVSHDIIWGIFGNIGSSPYRSFHLWTGVQNNSQNAMRVYYLLIMGCKTQFSNGLLFPDSLQLFWSMYISYANIQCNELMLNEVWVFLSCHGVNIECLRTVRPGVTCLPTLVAHYGIWASPASHINVHHIGVLCRSQCDSKCWAST